MIKRLLSISLVGLYSLVYLVLAIQMAGAGHGTVVFLAPLLTWVLPVICFFLLDRLDHSSTRIFFIVLLAVHYLVTLALFSGYSVQSDDGLMRMWGRFPYFVSVTALWYLAGQIFMWLKFATSLVRLRQELQ